MESAITYSDIQGNLRYAFLYDKKGKYGKYEVNPADRVRLVGLLFARPSSQLAKAEVIPNLKYFHHRSGEHINFYLAGYREGWAPEGDDEVVGKAEIHEWIFSDSKFNAFRMEIECLSSWKYSGGVDLILTNAKYDTANDKAYLDFSSAVQVNLDRAKKDGLIISVEQFFEQIFQYAEAQDDLDPAWGFSDAAGKKLAGSAFKQLLLSFIPKKLGEEAEKALHLAVGDISR